MKLSQWLLIAALSASAGAVAGCTRPKTTPVVPTGSTTEPSPQTRVEPNPEPTPELRADSSPEPPPEPEIAQSSGPNAMLLNPQSPSAPAVLPADGPTPADWSVPAPTEAPPEPAPKQESVSAVPAKPSTAATASSPSPEISLLTDTTVVPGERVGPITRNTSRENLASLFGEDRLSDEPVNIGEGFTEPGTVVDLGPEQSFTIVWQDGSRTQTAVVRDFGSAWQTPEGISLGTSFDELRAVLGSFQLYGFAWDYEGSLVLEDSQLDAYQGNLTLRVTPNSEAIANHKNAYQSVVGDQLLRSDNPNLDPLDISVYEMIVYLNGE